MIINETKKTIICKEEKILSNIFQKAKGLMFTTKIKNPLVFVFNEEKKISFHMFFVFYNIDLIFIDSKYKVVEIKESFKPFTFYKGKNKAKYILELKEGTIKKTKTNIGDIINISDSI
jgi:uncharacterized protein